MSENIFKACKTESEIMKRLFELSSSDKYSRQQLLHMAGERRAELKSEQTHAVKFVKVVLPESPPQTMNEIARNSVIITGDPKASSMFEFLSDGRVRF